MQTLPDLRFSESDRFERVRYRLTEYLARIVQVVNHNALDREWVWTMEAPANGTYVVAIPNAGRKIVAVAFALQAGTCTAAVSQGAQTVSWTGSGTTSLSVTTTDQTDTAASANEFVADTAVKIALSSVSGASGLCVSLRTGR